MATMLFATCRLQLDKETVVEPNCRIPDEVLKKLGDKPGKGRAELILRGFAVERSVTPTSAPVTGAKIETTFPHEWRYAPETLKGKSLDELNILIVEHTKKHGLAAVPPFADKDEAIFYLGHDIAKK